MDTPATQSAVLARIRAFARAQGWTPGRLASEAGLSRGTLSRLFETDWLPSSSTVIQIEGLIPRNWRAGDPLPEPKRKKAA